MQLLKLCGTLMILLMVASCTYHKVTNSYININTRDVSVSGDF